MCRFLAYHGEDIVLSSLVVEPEYSMIRQSRFSRYRNPAVNGDGLGVGWYAPQFGPEPGLYRSVIPAWSDDNFTRLSKKISSGCFFAHIRDASDGMPVNQLNCHPFQIGNYLWMHNGKVSKFLKIKRALLNILSDEFYLGIRGNTDSEHIFALFLHLYAQAQGESKKQRMISGMLETVSTLNELTDKVGERGRSHYNFAFTDGEEIIVTRYADSEEIAAPSLFYWSGIGQIGEKNSEPQGIIVASEPFTAQQSEWVEIPPKSLAFIDSASNISFTEIPV